MQPLAALTEINHIELDTVIIWDDGSRAVAYAYKDGKVMRTMPLTSASTNEQVNELRGQFRITDGQLYSFQNMAPVSPAEDFVLTASQPLPQRGPSRWG